MAYEPKEWACGEVVTADALNHIEQGIAEAGGSGTSLVTNVYELSQVTVKANTSKASYINFSTPIALSKIRAMWVQTNGRTFSSLLMFDGNLSADQVYMIQYNIGFIPLENDTQSQVTVTPKLYITTEE